MKNKLFAILALVLACAAHSQISTAYAQGTAFSYQGQLNTASGLANGTYDLTFTLFNTNAGGILISGPVTNSAVSVSNGLFTVAVDFGSAPFTLGQALWLEIGARTNGAAAFSTLAPRQAVLSTPIATYADSVNSTNLIGPVPDANLAATFTSPHSFNNAANAFTGDGSGLTALNASNLTTGTVSDLRLSSNVALRNAVNNFTGASNTFSGSVGIGTATPAKALDVTGTASRVATGASIDPSIFVRVSNPASDGNTSSPDFAGIGFGRTAVQQAIVGGTFGNDFLDFYTGGSLTAPKMRIDINGTVGIMTNDVLEFGYGVAGKEPNAGRIGYEKFTADSLDIVGAGTNSASRKIKFWAEGGANFNGNVGIGTTTPNSPLAVVGNIYMGTERPNTTFNQVGDTIYLGAEQKYLGNTLGSPVDGSTDWINLMANPLSSGIMFGLSGSTTTPHSNTVPLMVIKSNGNVGIGIGATNPATTLQVNGTVTATAFSGTGSGLTGVALLSGGNALTGQQTVMSGNVGIGTTTPSAHFHVNGGTFETPLAAALFEVQNCGAACALPTWTEAIRLENTEVNLTGEVGMGFLTAPAGSSLTNVPDVWIGTDDKASGNTHSFKIATQAGGVLVNRVFINGASGNVGIGTTTPTGPLTVATTHGTVTIANSQFVPELIANGGTSSGHMRFRNALEVWPDTNNVNAGYLDVRGTNNNPVISLDGGNGNVTCVAVNITSDRNAKENFSPVNARAVLDKVARLPISEWQYKQQSDTRHIGPMAQDFSSAFALGQDDKHISMVDEGGVALAAIQGLNEKLEETRAQNAELRQTVNDLKNLVEQLKAHLGERQGE